MNIRNTIGAVAAVLVGMALGYVLFNTSQPEVTAMAVSPSGTTWSTQKIASAEVTTAATNTIVSLVNNDLTDRMVDEAFCYIQPLNTTNYPSFQIQVATSTGATTGIIVASATNTNLIAAAVLASSTGQPYNFFVNRLSTTTAFGAGGTSVTNATSTALWPSGTAINFVANQPLNTGSGGACGVRYYGL